MIIQCCIVGVLALGFVFCTLYVINLIFNNQSEKEYQENEMYE